MPERSDRQRDVPLPPLRRPASARSDARVSKATATAYASKSSTPGQPRNSPKSADQSPLAALAEGRRTPDNAPIPPTGAVKTGLKRPSLGSGGGSRPINMPTSGLCRPYPRELLHEADLGAGEVGVIRGASVNGAREKRRSQRRPFCRPRRAEHPGRPLRSGAFGTRVLQPARAATRYDHTSFLPGSRGTRNHTASGYADLITAKSRPHEAVEVGTVRKGAFGR
jgi:hypothetical protein